MLEILVLGAICAIIGAIPTLIGIFRNKNDKPYVKNRIITGIVFFILDFFWMVILLYTSCKTETLLTMVMWSWPALLINLIFVLLFQNYDEIEMVGLAILPVISGMLCIVSLFGPVQKLIYVHDMENVEVAYTVSSDEILAKIDLSILNGANYNTRDKYTIDEAEMRKIDGKDMTVYHIGNKDNTGNYSEYIPGFAVMEKGEMPKVISKRMYFDYSYINSKDALRTVRRKYPNIYIQDSKFDIDDKYIPYQIYAYRENLLYSNGKDYGVIILNLQDGTSERYQIGNEEFPDWLDFKTTYPR